MARIAVEDSMGNVKQVLQDNGYEVVSLKGNNVPDCDCCVISGQDENMMGMSDRMTEASIIDATGMSADQVLQEVKHRIEKLH